MGRKPYKNFNLPKGMRARKRGKNIYYYLDTGARPRKEISLGSDYAMAVQKWAQLTMHKQPDVITFRYVADQYFKHVVPGKSPRSQKDNAEQIEWLFKFFDNPPAPIDKIEPKHVRQYMDWRINQSKALALSRQKNVTESTGQVRANRETSLFSHIFNFAREYGYTKQQNPCSGVRKFKEKGRVDVYVSDDMFKRVIAHSDKQTEFTLKLAYLTGQRPADVLKMSQTNINDGYLHLKQGKTDTKLRIEIAGELAQLLNDIEQYKQSIKNNVRSMYLLVNERGQPLTYETFRYRFDQARDKAGIDKGKFQLRDMRAKAATDTDETSGIRNAQVLLGHTTENMTAHYVRDRVGRKVKPVK